MIADNRKYSVVIGDVNSRLSDVFTRLKKLHSSNNFAFAIVAGDLFAAPEAATNEDNEEVTRLLHGEIEVPLPTYFSLGHHDLPAVVIEKLKANDGEVCPNLMVLGRKASIKTSEGFRIVAIGGVRIENSNDQPMDDLQGAYNDKDVEDLESGIGEADLLITSDWPLHIRTGSKVQYSGDEPASVQSIAKLCTAAKPRYHFSSSSMYFEREPFFHTGASPRSVTRFISLAAFGNKDKQKWIYAFQLEPSASPPESLPETCTASPFILSTKRNREAQEDARSNFRYANDNAYFDHDAPPRNKRQRQRFQPQPQPRQCYFCLGRDDLAKHMIGSISDNAYVTIAKGPLSTHATFPGLGFPGHMLIIPVQHCPTISFIPENDRQPTLLELQRYRDALHNMIEVRSTDSDGRARLGAVTWEISRGSGVHLHWQFLPLPVDKALLVEAAFDKEAENMKYPKFVKGVQEIAEAEKGDYFKVMVWSEDFTKDLILPLDQTFRFDLQFGRKVLAMLLGLEDRMDWRSIAQTMEEETADKDAFMAAFKAYDFSLS